MSKRKFMWHAIAEAVIYRDYVSKAALDMANKERGWHPRSTHAAIKSLGKPRPSARPRSGQTSLTGLEG